MEADTSLTRRRKVGAVSSSFARMALRHARLCKYFVRVPSACLFRYSEIARSMGSRRTQMSFILGRKRCISMGAPGE
eukprot:61214-Pleurochrysis_carterae.AAC.1